MAQDTENIKTKINVTYPKYIREAEAKGRIMLAAYWRDQITYERLKLKIRAKNKKKNEKGQSNGKKKASKRSKGGRIGY